MILLMLACALRTVAPAATAPAVTAPAATAPAATAPEATAPEVTAEVAAASDTLHLAPGRSVPLEVAPLGDWSAVERLDLTIASLAGPQDPPPELELRVHTAGGTWHWRRFEVLWSEPTTVHLPLAWLRPGGEGSVPGWTDVVGVRLYSRNRAALEVGAVTVVPGGPGAAWVQPEQVAALVYSGAEARVIHGPLVSVVTDVEELDAAAVQAVAERVEARLQALLPGLPGVQGPAVAVLTRDPEGWRRVPEELARALAADLGRISGTGYTLHGVAATRWDPEEREALPVLQHELAHALVSRRCALPAASGSWLQEGLASLVREQLSPQPGLAAEMRTWEGAPAAEWARGQRLRTSRYWQALALVDLLTRDPELAPRWPALLAAMAEAGHVDLGRLAPAVLGIELEALDARLAAWIEAGGPPP